MDNKKAFNYTYSAKEQEEIKKIREKYEEKEKTQDKMTQLRNLDAAVTKKATVVSLVFGIIGALIMGSGMSLVMTDIGEILNLEGTASLVIGIVTGIIGMVLVGCAYPVYNRIVKKERKKIAPQILNLADELLK